MDNKLECYRELSRVAAFVRQPDVGYEQRKAAWERIDLLLDTISDLTTQDVIIEEVPLE